MNFVPVTPALNSPTLLREKMITGLDRSAAVLGTAHLHYMIVNGHPLMTRMSPQKRSRMAVELTTYIGNPNLREGPRHVCCYSRKIHLRLLLAFHKTLGLLADVPLFLFGAMGGGRDPSISYDHVYLLILFDKALL